jgi:Major Facilitator Superfamily
VQNLFARLVSFLGVPAEANARHYAWAVFVDAIGTGIVAPLLVIFLVTVRHLDIPLTGLILSAAAAVAIVFTPYAGSLVARYGAKRLLVVSLGLNAGLFLLIATLEGTVLIAAALILHFVVERVARTARQVLATRINEDDRNQLLAVHRALRNSGFAVGAAIASLLLLDGSGMGLILALALNAASCALAAIIAWRIATKLEDRDGNATNKVFFAILADKDYMLAGLLNGVVGLHSSLLTIGIPVLIIRNPSIPPYAAGLAIAMNTILVALFLVSLSSRHADLAGASACYRRALFPYAAAFALLLAASLVNLPIVAIALLLGSVLILTFGELLTSVSEFLVSVEMADPNNKARYLTVFGLGHDMQDILGPALIAFVLAWVGDLSWLLFGLIIVGATYGLARITHRRSAPDRLRR